MPATDLLEEGAGLILVEFRVASLDDEKEAIIAHALEAFPVKERMIPLRKPVEGHDREDRGERREEHGQLEEDREERRDRVEIGRFAMNDDRKKLKGRDHGQQTCGNESGGASDEHWRGEPRFSETHRLVHSVDREGRMHIPTAKAGVPHFLRSSEKLSRTVELRSQTVDFAVFSHRSMRSMVSLGSDLGGAPGGLVRGIEVRIGGGENDLHLGGGNHRQEAHEEEKERKENAERAGEGPDLDPA